MIRLAVIIAHQFLPRMQAVQQSLQERCELTILTYSQLSDTCEHYKRHYAHVDGIIITELGYLYLEERFHGSFAVPTYIYRISEEDFYKCLFQLSVERKDIDFSRVCIDFIMSHNDYMGLKPILDHDHFPQTFPYTVITDQIYQELSDYHIGLWKDNKIDFSITRVGNIVPKLEQHGVPHIYLVPSHKSIVQQFEHIITEIEMIKLADNQIAIGCLSIHKLNELPSATNDLELKTMLLHKSLLEFTMVEKIPLIIQKTNVSFEMISSAKDLKVITDSYTRCKLTAFLSQHVPFEVNLGWGTGDTMYKARMNAQLANQQSASSPVRGTFVIQMNGQVIGPLGEETNLTYLNEVSPQIQRLSEMLDISTLQIQKIMGVITKTESNELTSEEIAYHLGITIRSANRILNQLEEKGIAHIAYKKQEKLRGRPKKIYKISFPAG
ncbi:transcriptional regulator [Paenibacillus sp. 32352]|uniref:transcriptional regulator n=1 Tax=Paenibacillus sp. 32352 TaxID=1969111 RepID=UPI0009ACC21B|nr:transcriptional regulator [Paenibacillus sp. 32352]